MIQKQSFPFMLSLLLTLIINILSQEPKIIQMSPHNYGVCLQGHVYGGSANSFCIRVDIATQYTWMHKKDFHVPQDIEKTIQSDISMTTADNVTLYGREVELPFGWNSPSGINMTLLNFHAYVFDSPEPHITTRTSIGLAAKYKGEEFSFIHQYYRKGMIEDLAFSIVHRSARKGGLVYLGGIPEEATMNKQHAEIKVLGKTHLWDFLLPEVIVQRDNIAYVYKSTKDHNDYAFLDSVRRYTYAPKEFFAFLIDVVYKEEYAQNICTFEAEEFYQDRKISCPKKEGITDRLGDITFQIEDYQYTVPMSFFWKCNDTQCVLSIIENHVSGNWRFCMNFIYDSALFMISNQTIHLYLEDEVTVNYHPMSFTGNYSLKIGLIVVISITMFAGIALLALFKIKKLV